MKHLLDISQLSQQDVITLLQRAAHFKHCSKTDGFSRAKYAAHTVVNLFYEHSTRTRISFELAAKKLGISVINFDLERSSHSKGETIEDTFNTLMAMGVDLFVLRHNENGLPHKLSTLCGSHAHLINAGDGKQAHPSQALLDLMTILEKKTDLHLLKIAIVGDVLHSRVANSLRQLCGLMGVGELVLVAPKIWWTDTSSFGQLTTSWQEGLTQADVLICLRIQRERLEQQDTLDIDSYRQDYALTREKLAYAKNDAIVMHPGPINRGVEIDSEVADGVQSCILQQVHNGVFMRMAIFEALLGY